jgi:glycosyltransferase involved in cell wall biosynthesis
MRVAFCPPELGSFQRALRGEPANATYLIQALVASRLRTRGHALTFIAPRDIGVEICTTDPEVETPAPRAWSARWWFRGLAAGTWRIQRALGVPYLNVFNNLALYDVCLRCLPGHDVVYQRHALYRDGIARGCARLGVPHVLFVEADEILEHDLMKTPITGLLRWRAGRMFRHNLQAADRVICVSEPLKSHLVARWGVPPEAVVVLPNAVDAQVFRPDDVARSRVRASLGIAGDAPVVLFVGNFYEWHDVETVLAAMATVVRAHPAVRLVLVGDGATRVAMQQRAHALGLAEVAHFTGLVAHAEVPQYMSAADVAVVPYPRLPQEVWLSPLKLFEYMASGLAIVASAAGQVSDVLRDGANALLVPPGDAAAMATACTHLIDDHGSRTALGAQARSDAVQRHSWDEYIRRLEWVFEDAREGRRKVRSEK